MVKLPYLYGALEPFIDIHTLGVHYQKHYMGYLNKLNDLLVDNNFDFNLPMEFISNHLDKFSIDKKDDVLFNLGGVLNHIIYFHSMSDKKERPNGVFFDKILSKFGSLDNFKALFKDSALRVRGSGYTYLVCDSNKELSIVNMFNQDCPYFHNLIPLLCIDLWEHAYYINYENKRDLYIDNFFEVMEFAIANKMYNIINNKS